MNPSPLDQVPQQVKGNKKQFNYGLSAKEYQTKERQTKKGVASIIQIILFERKKKKESIHRIM